LHVTVASEGEWTDSVRADKVSAQPGFTPAPLEATVNSGFEYHLVGGVDYYINDHMSVYVDARYVWSNTQVNITIDGGHQVRLGDFKPGKLQTLSNGSAAALNLWEDQGIAGCLDCKGDKLYETEDSNGNGELDRNGCGPNGDPKAPCEGGTLYVFPVGPNPNNPNGIWDSPTEAIRVEPCAQCAANDTSTDPNLTNSFCGAPHSRCDSEDANLNGMMDRFRLYGVDVCSMINASTN